MISGGTNWCRQRWNLAKAEIFSISIALICLLAKNGKRTLGAGKNDDTLKAYPYMEFVNPKKEAKMAPNNDNAILKSIIAEGYHIMPLRILRNLLILFNTDDGLRLVRKIQKCKSLSGDSRQGTFEQWIERKQIEEK
nr:9819_t:CDS:2 [Entrophospora candida]